MNLNKPKRDCFLNTYIPYIIAIILFIGFKLAFTKTNNDWVLFLLRPTNFLVECFTGSYAVYQSDIGYFYSQLNIVIDKSCSGFNYWMLCFLMLVFSFVRKENRLLIGITLVLFALVCSFVCTIFVNTFRIYVSMVIQSQHFHFLNAYPAIVHEVIGVTINLSFLVLIYYLSEKLINTYTHEKLA